MKLLLLFLSASLISADQKSIEEFTTANNLFTRSIYKVVTKVEDGNFLLSPFPAETLLAFVQSGCKGDSAEQLRRVLHFPNDKTKIENAVKTLLPKIRGNDLYTLNTANKVYVKENYTLKEEFKTSAKSVYFAEIEPINFKKNIEAASTMNKWVEKQTNEKIKNLIDSQDLDENTRSILINALYFKANWSLPFPLAETYKQPFYKTSTETVEVETLNHFGKYFNYYESFDLKAQFLELFFTGEEASMVIVLPKEKNGLASLENQLEQVFDLSYQLKSELLNVALPKFNIESTIDFKKVLERLGVKDVFDSSKADLSGIAGEKGDLVVNKAVQKTFVDVSEEGVEAAAATFVAIAVLASAHIPEQTPKHFIADHPFIFYIKVKDLVLFAGRVTDPSRK